MTQPEALEISYGAELLPVSVENTNLPWRLLSIKYTTLCRRETPVHDLYAGGRGQLVEK